MDASNWPAIGNVVPDLLEILGAAVGVFIYIRNADERVLKETSSERKLLETQLRADHTALETRVNTMEITFRAEDDKNRQFFREELHKQALAQEAAVAKLTQSITELKEKTASMGATQEAMRDDLREIKSIVMRLLPVAAKQEAI